MPLAFSYREEAPRFRPGVSVGYLYVLEITEGRSCTE
jgi:hypothetical protein